MRTRSNGQAGVGPPTAGRGAFARLRAALVAGLLALALFPATASAQEDLPTAAVTLGDSYISGESGRWFGNSNTQWGSRRGTDRAAYRRSWWRWGYDQSRVYLDGTASNDCHRSDVAPVLSAALEVSAAINLACSGATTDNVVRTANGGRAFKGEAPQADRLMDVAATHDVELVVLSIGGNDLGFAEIIGLCASAWTADLGACNRVKQPFVDAVLPAVAQDVGATIDDVRAVLAEAGQPADTYRLVVQTYPSPVPRAAEARYPETGWRRLDTGGCPFYDADLDWARDDLVDQLADTLAGVAVGRGAEVLDLRDLLQGREVCATASSLVTRGSGGPSATSSEWARFLVSGIGQGELQESFHPNAYGQQAIGACYRALVATSPGVHRCTNVPGASSDAVDLTTG